MISEKTVQQVFFILKCYLLLLENDQIRFFYEEQKRNTGNEVPVSVCNIYKKAYLKNRLSGFYFQIVGIFNRSDIWQNPNPVQPDRP